MLQVIFAFILCVRINKDRLLKLVGKVEVNELRYHDFPAKVTWIGRGTTQPCIFTANV